MRQHFEDREWWSEQLDGWSSTEASLNSERWTIDAICGPRRRQWFFAHSRASGKFLRNMAKVGRGEKSKSGGFGDSSPTPRRRIFSLPILGFLLSLRAISTILRDSDFRRVDEPPRVCYPEERSSLSDRLHSLRMRRPIANSQRAHYVFTSDEHAESRTKAIPSPFPRQEKGSDLRRWPASSADVRRLQGCRAAQEND